MDQKLTQESIVEILSKLEHPEINNTLVELGMLHDIKWDADKNEVSLILALPMMNIAESVRNYLINIIYLALEPLGVTPKLYLAQMTEAEREHFFSLSQKNWKEGF